MRAAVRTGAVLLACTSTMLVCAGPILGGPQLGALAQAVCVGMTAASLIVVLLVRT
jgi:hypothetical protein